MSRFLGTWQAILGSLRPSRAHVRPPRKGRRRTSPLRLALEQLEDRLVLTTYTVSTLADGVAGSLRDAITQANAHHGTDKINFQPRLAGTISLTGGELGITDDLTITGPGAGRLTVSGNETSRIFTVGAGEKVTISGLTIANGNAGSGDGGGLINFGTVTVSNCAFTRDSAGLFGGGLANESGGKASVSGSTFTGNSAALDGGGLANFGTADVSGSTFSS